MTQHYIEIEAREKNVTRLYRFYGLGQWKVRKGRCWRTINAVFVPCDVLKLAASFCSQLEAAT